MYATREIWGLLIYVHRLRKYHGREADFWRDRVIVFFLGSFERPFLTLGAIFQASPGGKKRRVGMARAAEAQGEARKGVSDGQLSHLSLFAGAIALWEIQRPFRLSVSTSP